MREIILALAIPLAMLIASPALAVKVVARDDKPQKENAGSNTPHQADSPSTAARQDRPSTVDPGTAKPRDPAVRPDGRHIDQSSKGIDSSRDRRVGPVPEQSRDSHHGRRDIKGNDNFIDENHDGVDDRLQRPPEVIKKKEPKREHAPEQAPQQSPEKERQRERQLNQEHGKRSR